jgi:hypothetical protein
VARGWHQRRRVRPGSVTIDVKISLRLDLGMPTLSQTARKDGAPAGSVKINVEISLRWIWECPPSPRTTRGKGGAAGGGKPTSGAKTRETTRMLVGTAEAVPFHVVDWPASVVVDAQAQVYLRSPVNASLRSAGRTKAFDPTRTLLVPLHQHCVIQWRVALPAFFRSSRFDLTRCWSRCIIRHQRRLFLSGDTRLALG